MERFPPLVASVPPSLPPPPLPPTTDLTIVASAMKNIIQAAIAFLGNIIWGTTNLATPRLSMPPCIQTKFDTHLSHRQWKRTKSFSFHRTQLSLLACSGIVDTSGLAELLWPRTWRSWKRCGETLSLHVLTYNHASYAQYDAVGSLAAWLQNYFRGGRGAAGGWFSLLQAVGMGVIQIWVGFVLKAPLIGSLLAMVLPYFARA